MRNFFLPLCLTASLVGGSPVFSQQTYSIPWDYEVLEKTDAKLKPGDTLRFPGSDQSQSFNWTATEEFLNAVAAEKKKDFPEAVRILRLLAEGGDVRAQNRMGYYSAMGRGTPQDYGQAREWYLKADKNGYVFSSEGLGLLYAEGKGVPRRIDTAIAWFQKGAKRGLRSSELSLASIYVGVDGSGPKVSEGIQIIRKLADGGSADAQQRLGGYYFLGIGVDVDFDKAFYWTKKAADQGNPEAENGLGVMYQRGNGVTRNYETALYWYKKSAQHGNHAAEQNAGALYVKGMGVARDLALGVRFLEAAAEGGVAGAEYDLAHFYDAGVANDLPRNPVQAALWYEKAANHGHGPAQHNLANMYRAGDGVVKNEDTAFKWESLAAEQGIAYAQFGLGSMYGTGQGVQKNPEKAVEWYYRAAIQGVAAAQIRLARSYDSGEGVARDPKAAFGWLLLAAQQGNSSIQREVADRYEKGNGVPRDEKKARVWRKLADDQDPPVAPQPPTARLPQAVSKTERPARRDYPVNPGPPQVEFSPMPTPRMFARAVECGGLIYILGGRGETGETAAVEAYDPISNQWSSRQPMPSIKKFFATACVDGRVFVIGGQAGAEEIGLKSVEAYEPGTDSWASRADLAFGRKSPAAVVVGGKLLILGGLVAPGILAPKGEEYDFGRNRWTSLPPMPTPRYEMASAVWGDSVFLFGGIMPINPRASGVHSKAEALDASTGQWRTLEPLVGNRAGAGAAVIDGQIYVGGGFNAQGIPQNVEVYDAETGRRIPGNHFSVLARIGAASATDGKRLFFFGGSPRGNGPPTGHVEAFDPTVRQSIIGLGVRPKNPDGGGGVVPPTAMNARPQSEARPGSLRRGFPDDIGVVIGVEKYDSLPSADFAVNDARGMSEFLTTALGLGERRVANFFGQGHTQMRVEMALAGPMRLSVRPNTRLFIFFSGHGIPDPESGEVSLALWDTDLGVPRRRGLPLSTLYRHLEMFEAKEIVVFLDACFSGTGPRSAPKPGLRPLVSQLESLKPKEKRISILSAAAGVQTAGTKKDAEHGLFSYYLLKGLAGEADGNGDKHLSLKELHSYLKKKVSADARRENRDQDPQLFTSNPDLNIY